MNFDGETYAFIDIAKCPAHTKSTRKNIEWTKFSVSSDAAADLQYHRNRSAESSLGHRQDESD